MSLRFLSGNRISVLEGLENQEKMTELKLDHQRLPPGEGLMIDQQSLKACRVSMNFLFKFPEVLKIP